MLFSAIEIQPDDKILIAGKFKTGGAVLWRGAARLNSNGSLEATFNQGRGATADMRALKIRGSNKLLVGGAFFRHHTILRRALAQVNL